MFLEDELAYFFIRVFSTLWVSISATKSDTKATWWGAGASTRTGPSMYNERLENEFSSTTIPIK